RRVGVGKQSDHRNPQLGGAFRCVRQQIYRQAIDTGHGRYGLAPLFAVHDKNRPDEIRRGKPVLGNKLSRPIVPAQATHAEGGEPGIGHGDVLPSPRGRRKAPPPARGCCAGGKGGPISAGHSGAAMDFDLTEDERAVEDTARRFAKDRLAPFAAEWDAREFFPVETLREAAALGFAGIYVKSDVGGSEMSRLDAAIIMEELSAGCTSTAAFISIHNMASWMIDRFKPAHLRA